MTEKFVEHVAASQAQPSTNEFSLNVRFEQTIVPVEWFFTVEGLRPVLGTTVRERHRPGGPGPEEGHDNDRRSERVGVLAEIANFLLSNGYSAVFWV